jgi:hypothetical protein
MLRRWSRLPIPHLFMGGAVALFVLEALLGPATG